jgi:hypothetical protein
MDLVRELRGLVLEIRSALDDGRISPIEALRIAKEMADVIYVLYQIFASGIRPWAAELEERLSQQNGT